MPFIFQKKESVMLNRTLLSSVAAVAFSALLLVSTPAVAGEIMFNADSQNVHGATIGNAVVLGQSDTRRNPTLFDRFRQGLNKFFQDDAPESSSNQRPAAAAAPPAIPTTPPKPPTAAEIRDSAATSQQTQQRTTSNVANSGQTRAGTISVPFRDVSDETIDESDIPIHVRLQSMRESFFPSSSYQAIEEAAKASRATSNVSATPLFPLPSHDFADTSRGSVGNVTETPMVPRHSATLDERGNTAAPRNAEMDTRGRQVAPRGEPMPGTTPPMEEHLSPSQQAVQRIAAIDAGQRREQPGNRLVVSASPRLEIEVELPPSVVLNQEITHRIRVTNVGDAPADGVVINTEIPSWIDIRHMDASNGNVVLRPRDDGSGVTDLEWKINRISQSATDMLVLRSISLSRQAFELHVRHDFLRPAIIAKVEVQEPKLEMELIGADEVRWNDVAVYTLLVHNTGNGDAENVRLELLQTSSPETSSCEFPEPLRPGETQELSIEVRRAGKEQEHIDIAVLATGSHDLKAEIRRRIRVLRPKLEVSVQTLPLHFVDNPVELTVRVRNIGTADADNMVIRAELPLGARYGASSEGGIFAVQQQQSVVEWRGRSIARGELQTFTLVCIPQREGECRVSVEVSEHSSSPSGSILATTHGTFMAEAIVELDLAVLAPRGPIELGQEVEYEVLITNTGTKAAENVEIAMTFGRQLEPTGVRGGEAKSTDDGQVFFDKIPAILPKQCVTVNVIVRAEEIGTAPIRAEVTRTDANGAPVSLQKGLAAYIVSRRGAMTASEETHEIVR
jgi:hypothetical protein